MVYQCFNEGESTYLSRPNEENIDITGALTIGVWIWCGNYCTGREVGIVSRWIEGTDDRQFAIYKDANDKFVFAVSSLGTAVSVVSVDDDGDRYEAGKWLYIVGRYTPSNELALFINNHWYLNTTSIPASLHSPAITEVSLDFGRYNADHYFVGRMTHGFLCAYAVPDNFIEANFGHVRAMFLNRRD